MKIIRESDNVRRADLGLLPIRFGSAHPTAANDRWLKEAAPAPVARCPANYDQWIDDPRAKEISG